jgi:uncharacterized membrane protein YeaQ/YmgE (transglycosylase-associated protein family)
MSILGWIVLGLIAGWIGSNIVDNGGRGPLLDMVLGIVGAVVGGAIFNALGGAGSFDETLIEAKTAPSWAPFFCAG